MARDKEEDSLVLSKVWRRLGGLHLQWTSQNPRSISQAVIIVAWEARELSEALRGCGESESQLSWGAGRK